MTRRFIAAVLLASTVASPLLAQDHDRWQHGDDGGRQRGDRPSAPQQAPQRLQAPQPQAQQQASQQRDWRGGADRRGDGAARGFERRPDQPQARPPMVPPLGQPQQRRPDQRWDRNGDGRRDPRPGDFSGRSPFDRRSPYEHAPTGRRDDGRRDNQQWQRSNRDDHRPGYQVGRDRADNGGGWDRDRDRRWDNGWRSDRRYDWRGWRNSNRDLFRGPRYAAPRDWSYRRFAPGYRIAPFLFAQQYWIDDPWQYRLPPAYGPYRWVRYYDDVLLIDIRSGLVVDAIPNFFF